MGPTMASHRHLARLERVWIERPIFFITTCTADRRGELANARLHEICREVWHNSQELYGWLVGRYVLMPDHVHFFCAPRGDDRRLELFVGKWKEWTAKYAHARWRVTMPLWQEEFFDHALRSEESYDEKWRYVRENPVRAQLVGAADDWPYQGELNALGYG
jgi:putative transposase